MKVVVGTFLKLSVIALVAMTMLMPEAAFAQQKMGDVMKNTTKAFSGIPLMLSMISYIAGLFLIVVALIKFKEHVDHPDRAPLSAGVKRFIASGCFLSLPFMVRVMRGSLFAAEDNRPTKGDNFTDPSTAMLDGSVEKMIVDFIGNIAVPASNMLTFFAYIAGIAFLLVGISRLTKRMEDGPRGPTGMGTIMTFIAAGALFSFGNSIGVFASTVFGDNKLLMHANIGGNVIAEVEDRERLQKIIEGLLIFVMLVGYIAFIRGWFVMKAFADGAQGATLAQGLTFLIGGTIAINLGELINVLSATVGINNALWFT